jgi:hypothetical protein
MIINKKIMVEKEVPENIICNCCGKPIEKIGGYFKEYVHIEKIWGYGSEKDGEKQSVDLCEKCWDEITNNFIVKP